MEIRIIAPGTDCKTTKTNIACKIACNILEEIFYEALSDVMSIHIENGDCIAEISVDNGFKLVTICRHGVFKKYCLPDAEDIVSNIISDYTD